jgi:hypothetical protein
LNLADYRQRVAFAIGATTSNASELDLIDDYVNEGVVKFLEATKVNVLTAVLGVTAGSGDYTLDTDILAFTDVWYEPADREQLLLEPVDSREIQRMRRIQEALDSSPRYYAVPGAHLLLLHPLPSSDDDLLHILYVPRPAAMSATADSPADALKGNVPYEYHDVIEAYAKWKVAQQFEHRPSEYGLTFNAEYERGLKMVRASMNKKSGVFRAPKRAGRRRYSDSTPGTDLG